MKVLEIWTRLIIRKRTLVLALWILALALGVFSSTKLDSHLSTSLTIPGSPSAITDQILSQRFNENIQGTFTIVYPFSKANDSQIKSFEGQIASAAASIPTASVAEEKAIEGTLFANINTSLSLSKAAAFTQVLRLALKREGMEGALVTGLPAIDRDVTPILASDLHRGEFIAVSIALLLLILVLGFSSQILIPFLSAVGSISLTLGVIFLIAQKFLIVLYIPNIVELIGLGLAIDYSLLMLFRYRKELTSSPKEPHEAIVRTMATAGKTIALSGATVAVGLSTLILVPVPFVRSLGYASALVPLLSLVAAFTLQPALLSYFPAGKEPSKLRIPAFSWLPRLIVRRPLTVAISSIILLVALALPAHSLHITPSSLTAIPAQLESQRALALATSDLGAGVITPNELLIDLRTNLTASQRANVLAKSKLSDQLLREPDVVAVATGSKSPYVDTSERFLHIFVIGRHAFGSPQSQTLVNELRAISLTNFGFSASATLYVGGAAAQGADLIRVLSKTIPWILLLALLIIFLLLMRAFNSIVLPIKAILLDLISVAVTFGIVVLEFGNQPISKILGLYHLNQIEAWAALFLFVLLFGVSMDYEIFIISRIREAKGRGLSNTSAIKVGVTQTGVVVTTAALIFIGAVAGLGLGHFAGLQEIGIGLGFGVLIDATIVRGLLLPSAMVLLSDWNWWMPIKIARLMKTSPTPLREVRG